MKVAITVWNDRISPVFDVARNIMILDVADGVVQKETFESIDSDDAERKAARLKQLNIQTLICGAISRYHARLIFREKIEIIPFISGEIDEVIKAYLSARLPNPKLMMPGCCKTRRQHRQSGKKQY